MVIQTHQLTKQFKGKGGFQNISLSVSEGEVFCFLGKNGAGKSTFVRTLLGILAPTDGSATMLDHPIGHVETRRRVGYLPELFQYHPWLSGYELLYHNGLLYGMDPKNLKSRITEVLEIVGLTGHENKRIKEYSKGMKQRIGLGCAILNDPDLLFLDEPTSALDPVGRKHVRDIILELKSQGKTIFLNTHLLSEVELVADRVAIMDKGQLMRIGTLQDLLHSPLQITASHLNANLFDDLKKLGRLEIIGFDDPINSDSPTTLELFGIADNQIPTVANLLHQHHCSLYKLMRKDNQLESLFIEIVGKEDSR